MFRSNLCPLSCSQGKMPSLQNLSTQICFGLISPTPHFESMVNENYLLPLAAFCDSMRTRTQRTNYICNTDPSTPALNKVLISNYPRLQYQTCSRKTIKNSAISFLSHSFIIFFHPFIIKFAAFCVRIIEYDWPDNISKHCLGTFIPKHSKHTRNQSHFLSLVQIS